MLSVISATLNKTFFEPNTNLSFKTFSAYSGVPKTFKSRPFTRNING